MRDEAEGRRLLKRYLDAARSLSEAVGRAHVLTPGERPMVSFINRDYLDEWHRLEHAAKTAREDLDAWYREARPGGK